MSCLLFFWQELEREIASEPPARMKYSQRLLELKSAEANLSSVRLIAWQPAARYLIQS